MGHLAAARGTFPCRPTALRRYVDVDTDTVNGNGNGNCNGNGNSNGNSNDTAWRTKDERKRSVELISRPVVPSAPPQALPLTHKVTYGLPASVGPLGAQSKTVAALTAGKVGGKAALSSRHAPFDGTGAHTNIDASWPLQPAHLPTCSDAHLPTLYEANPPAHPPA